MMKNNHAKILVILLSILISIMTFYIAIPKFIDIESYRNLSKRLEKRKSEESSNPSSNQGNTKPNYNHQDPDPNVPSNPSDTNEENNHNSDNPTNPDVNENNNSSNSNNENNNSNEKPNGEESEEKPSVTEEQIKTFTVTFVSNGADQIGTNSLSCQTKTKSCEIVLPSIIKNGGEVYGWNESANATTGTAVGSTIQITKDQTLYAITGKKNTVTFEANGATLSFSKSTCTSYNESKSCQVTTPTIHRENGKGIGFSTNKNATTSEFGSTISVSNSMTVYAISVSNYQAYFDANGAYSISSKSLSCAAYNMNKSCNITAPTMEKDSYTMLGWSTNSEADDISYQVGSPIPLNNNLTFYAIRKIANSGFLTNNQEVLNLINNLRSSYGLSKLKWSKSLEHSAELRVKEIILSPNEHIRPNGSDFYTVNNLAYAENWTDSPTSDVNIMHQAFVNSPPHKANMLNDDYTIVGIAGIKDERTGIYYWVELFG